MAASVSVARSVCCRKAYQVKSMLWLGARKNRGSERRARNLVEKIRLVGDGIFRHLSDEMHVANTTTPDPLAFAGDGETMVGRRDITETVVDDMSKFRGTALCKSTRQGESLTLGPSRPWHAPSDSGLFPLSYHCPRVQSSSLRDHGPIASLEDRRASGQILIRP